MVPSEDPTALSRRLAAAAEEHPVYFDDALGAPVLVRGADVKNALGDPETFSMRCFETGVLAGTIIPARAEEHARLRRLHTEFMSPRAVARYEQSVIFPVARGVVDQLAGRERADLLDDFAAPAPVRIMSALLGLPLEWLEAHTSHIQAMLLTLFRPGDLAAAANAERAHAVVTDELRKIAERAIARPSDDLLGAIVSTLDAHGRATVEQCERILLTMLLGGLDTTTAMLASILVALCAHPDVMSSVRLDPALLPAAIDEATRWCGPIPGTIRQVERDVSFEGVTLTAGTRVFLGFSGLIYDRRIHDCPEVFNMHRKGGSILYGMGAHSCVGAPIGRLVARACTSVLLERFPALRADPDARPIFSLGARGGPQHGPDRLPALLS
ncbi:cytochrome P450 [Sorangium sp. So ce269]